MDNINLNTESIHQHGLVDKLKAAKEKVNKLGGAVAIEQLKHHPDVKAFKRLVKMKKTNLDKWEKGVDESANRESYEDSIRREIRMAHKKKDAERALYYSECLAIHSACVSFERFKGSAAYEAWKSRRDTQVKIASLKSEYNRFSYMNEAEKNYKCPRCKDTGQLIGKGQFVKGIKLSCPKCGTGKVVKEDSLQQFDVESDEHWNDEKMIGLMKQKDVGQGHGTLRFKSNSGTTYTVELDRGKILDLKDHRGNVYELTEIQKYWDEGFTLIGAISATIGDNDSVGPDEEEKQMLYSPEELQETDKDQNKEELPKKRCERCGKPVNPGISSRKCPSCHESDLADAERYYGVQEEVNDDLGNVGNTETQISPATLSEDAPPGFPKSIYEKLVIKFKGDKKKINEIMWAIHNKSKKTGQGLDEKAPPHFPKSLHDKLLAQYKSEPEKAYATMWKLHNDHGDKLESVVSEAKKRVTRKK